MSASLPDESSLQHQLCALRAATAAWEATAAGLRAELHAVDTGLLEQAVGQLSAYRDVALATRQLRSQVLAAAAESEAPSDAGGMRMRSSSLASSSLD